MRIAHFSCLMNMFIYGFCHRFRFTSHLYCCYQNYLLFYEQVETAMVAEMTSEDDGQCDHKPGTGTEAKTLLFTMQR